jgi:hypothetical protein
VKNWEILTCVKRKGSRLKILSKNLPDRFKQKFNLKVLQLREQQHRILMTADKPETIRQWQTEVINHFRLARVMYSIWPQKSKIRLKSDRLSKIWSMANFKLTPGNGILEIHTMESMCFQI